MIAGFEHAIVHISENKLLNSLGGRTFSKVAPALFPVALERGQMLAFPREHVGRVYFPHSGIISCVINMTSGGAVETCMVGVDGQWGASQAMDGKVALNAVIVKAPVTASAIDVDRLRQLADELPNFRATLLHYDAFLFAQVQLSAACNAVHSAEMRVCRSLLRMHDLVGRTVHVTQEELGDMIGVRRPSVTAIASELQQAGIISYHRGRIYIDDLGKLETRACGCARELRTFHKLLFG